MLSRVSVASRRVIMPNSRASSRTAGSSSMRPMSASVPADTARRRTRASNGALPPAGPVALPGHPRPGRRARRSALAHPHPRTRAPGGRVDRGRLKPGDRPPQRPRATPPHPARRTHRTRDPPPNSPLRATPRRPRRIHHPTPPTPHTRATAPTGTSPAKTSAPKTRTSTAPPPRRTHAPNPRPTSDPRTPRTRTRMRAMKDHRPPMAGERRCACRCVAR
jgi:hypothetical protein